jgi:hypothetical protein
LFRAPCTPRSRPQGWASIAQHIRPDRSEVSPARHIGGTLVHALDLLPGDNHIKERRGTALDKFLEEIAGLDCLRRLVTGLRGKLASGGDVRVAELLAFAERRLASCEAALSADGLAKRLALQLRS